MENVAKGMRVSALLAATILERERRPVEEEGEPEEQIGWKIFWDCKGFFWFTTNILLRAPLITLMTKHATVKHLGQPTNQPTMDNVVDEKELRVSKGHNTCIQVKVKHSCLLHILLIHFLVPHKCDILQTLSVWVLGSWARVTNSINQVNQGWEPDSPCSTSASSFSQLKLMVCQVWIHPEEI